MKLNLEYMGEDQEVPGSEKYKVEAIHVTTTRNRRKYTHEELAAAARSLSFRPLNINHVPSTTLPFNENGFLLNTTLAMHYNSERQMIEGEIRVSDSRTIERIDNKELTTVSIEQMPTKGESCSVVSCEQHGVIFIGLALLEADVMPGDPQARIITESFGTELISECIVSKEQRECETCTDFKACTKCSHGEADDCMEKCLSKKKADGITIDDQAIAICLSECGQSRDEQIALYENFKDYNSNNITEP